jgi:hypothetical protein
LTGSNRRPLPCKGRSARFADLVVRRERTAGLAFRFSPVLIVPHCFPPFCGVFVGLGDPYAFVDSTTQFVAAPTRIEDRHERRRGTNGECYESHNRARDVIRCLVTRGMLWDFCTHDWGVVGRDITPSRRMRSLSSPALACASNSEPRNVESSRGQGGAEYEVNHQEPQVVQKEIADDCRGHAEDH